MKNFLRLAIATAAIAFAFPAFADDRLKPNISVRELTSLPITSVAAGDYLMTFDTSANQWKKLPAEAIGTVTSFEDTTATNALDTSECGKTITLNSATEFVTTLPAPTAGCKFSFIVKAAPSGAAYTIVTNASANIFVGQVTGADLNAASDGDFGTTDDTISFVDGVAVVGDRVDVVSDGTSWYYIGYSRVFNGITATTAS